MNKIVIALLFVMMPSAFFAQSSVFDKFDGREQVTTVVVTKKMFELIGKIEMDSKDKEAQQYLDLVKKLSNLKVFSTSNSKIAAEMKGTVDGYLKSTALDELMRISEGGSSIKIYVKSGATANQVKELLMFIEGGGGNKDTVIMSLTGNFDLNDLSVLTDKMDLPGGEALKKASKK
ncbi:DUF4252 domain-containing protein [Flavobacterium rhizosphaerae]|uniref:DUF4252 domain-containing protein n=1 Tax=Flavobacterium rhizosphaerae TaxID=3163298 RepID=A0ABW8YZ28_9FLAO